MKERYSFGKLGSKIKYLYIDNNTISIKSGSLALFGDKFLTTEKTINIETITNIEIERPMMKPGYMIITTSSGEEFQVGIYTMMQYKNALSIKEKILNK